jgi:4-amino-4-deoxy-L-arabinose transferase-like glycosyltransferase
MTRRALLTIFMGALAIRWTYSATMALTLGDAGLLGVDSGDYVERGHELLAQLAAQPAPGWHWLGPKPFMMPLFAWLIALSAAVGGLNAALVHVLFQGAFDAGTCLLILATARIIDERYALPAGIAAAINPTQIVIAGQVYPDTLFVFFVALLLWSVLRWWRTPGWSAAAMIGIALLAAAWTRVLIAPFAVALVAFLIVAALVAGRLRRSTLAQLVAVLAVFGVSLTPIALRNHSVYGSWSLTPQGGQHLSRWVVPLIWESRDGKPWAQGYEEMERRADALPQPPGENMFQQSDRYRQVGLEALRDIDGLSISRAWAYGAALNLGTPALALSPPVMLLPRTGFYATPGASMPDKMFNFLFRSDNALYAWIILAGIGGLAVIRLLQAAGLVALLAQKHLVPVLLLTGWCAFILLVNGPVASPKYRLPMEPALMILAGAGWALLRRPSRAT